MAMAQTLSRARGRTATSNHHRVSSTRARTTPPAASSTRLVVSTAAGMRNFAVTPGLCRPAQGLPQLSYPLVTVSTLFHGKRLSSRSLSSSVGAVGAVGAARHSGGPCSAKNRREGQRSGLCWRKSVRSASWISASLRRCPGDRRIRSTPSSSAQRWTPPRAGAPARRVACGPRVRSRGRRAIHRRRRGSSRGLARLVLRSTESREPDDRPLPAERASLLASGVARRVTWWAGSRPLPHLGGDAAYGVRRRCNALQRYSAPDRSLGRCPARML